MVTRTAALCLIAACTSSNPAPVAAPTAPAAPPSSRPHSVIILIWDGLRPDAISEVDTPNLVRLRDGGVFAADHHSTYPTLTMMNAASIATGAFPDATGFYGNVVWQPTATGNDAAGKPVDFHQPVLSEDYGILDGLKGPRRQLLMVDTLFAAAQAAGLSTVAVGKTGAAYLQDTARAGMVLDERTAVPLAFARELQAAGIALPPTSVNAYPAGQLELAAGNGNPVEILPVHRFKDGVSSDPTDESGSPFKVEVAYLVHTYLDYLLPKHPRLTVLWLRDPDTTQHIYGVGTPNWHDAMKANDRLLGEVLARLASLGEAATTDIIVASDHGHSNVSGPLELFPLRAITDGAVGAIDPAGHSVSGLIRIADLLRRAGFAAFDGFGCTEIPAAMGIRRDGSPVYPDKIDGDGQLCGKPGQRYQIGPYKVPAEPPPHALVVAVNGGSDYLYAPDHDAETVQRAVRFLQGQSAIGAIFVDDRYGALPGTLPLSAIHARNAAGKNPDIIFSYDYDADAVVEGIPGTEMADPMFGASYRGMHGAFSPRDVHNTLIAYGPDFRTDVRDPLPTGNVDIAPTAAHILGIALPHAQGRPLLEALAHGPAVADFHVAPGVQRPTTPATGLTIHLPTDPEGKATVPQLSSFNFELRTKSLTYGNQTYTYFDSAKATRR